MTTSLHLSSNELYQEAQQHFEASNYQDALKLFYRVWIKLPQPATEQKTAGCLLTSIGDAYFHLQRFDPAIEALRLALTCTNTSNNPFTLLRLGQCLLESGLQDQARTYLQRAYRIGGAQLFKTEDNKYHTSIIDLVA